jgi:alpha-ribazole phosphatase
MLTTVYLVRHGSVVGAETRRFIGHLDVPLSPRGEAEAAALARRLASVKLIAAYASDLSRTRRTAELLVAPHGLQTLARPELREFSMGRWEGLTAEEIRALDPPAFAAWMADIGRFQFPEGESLADVEARAWPAFESIVERHAGGSVLVVAHGGPNRILLCRALGVPSERILSLGQDYAALSVLEHDRGRWRLRLLNHREPVRE